MLVRGEEKLQDVGTVPSDVAINMQQPIHCYFPRHQVTKHHDVL